MTTNTPSPSNTNTQAKLRIIQINDVYKLDNFPFLKTLIEHYKQEANEEGTKCIVICAGDFLAPSLLSSLDKGYGMTDVLLEIGCDYVCIGNHENDVGDDALRARILQCMPLASTKSAADDDEDTPQKTMTWINSNIPELNEKLGVNTPEYVTIEVDNEVKVALIGLLTEDPSLYRKGAFGGATIEPLFKTASNMLPKLSETHNSVIALTHQGIEDDRLMAKKFGIAIPLLCGGHDHEPYMEEIQGGNDSCCHIVKAGMDATHAAIIDLTWDKEGTNPCIKKQLVECSKFTPCQKIQQIVDKHETIIKELDAAVLFKVAEWTTTPSSASESVKKVFSTKDNRLGPSTGTTALCSMIRMGLRCDMSLINAGAVRAGRVYEKDANFTWSDLKAEMPFATKMVVARIPGTVIQDTIKYSRQWACQSGIAKGGYLHTSRTTICQDDGTIEFIMGEPFDPTRSYYVGFPYDMLQGIDNHKPLLEWARTKKAGDLPNGHVGIPVKYIIVQVFSTLLWLHLGEFAEIDTGKSGDICREELEARLEHVFGGSKTIASMMVDNIFSVADVDQSGTISALEQMMVHFAAKDMLSHVATEQELEVMTEIAKQVMSTGTGCGGSDDDTDIVNHEELARQLKQALDLKGDGKIGRDEIMQVLGQVQRKDLLE